MNKTIEELRQEDERRIKADAAEAKRLKEKVLCCELIFSPQVQLELGITGFTMKYDELQDFIEEEINNHDGNTVKFSVRFMMRTNKWIENLPEADI